MVRCHAREERGLPLRRRHGEERRRAASRPVGWGSRGDGRHGGARAGIDAAVVSRCGEVLECWISGLAGVACLCGCARGRRRTTVTRRRNAIAEPRLRKPLVFFSLFPFLRAKKESVIENRFKRILKIIVKKFLKFIFLEKCYLLPIPNCKSFQKS